VRWRRRLMWRRVVMVGWTRSSYHDGVYGAWREVWLRY
jgi:hypothetical protein